MSTNKPSGNSREYALSRSGRSDIVFRLRYWLSKYPSIYFPYARLIHSSVALNKGTQLLIEGYCRSASSFAAECFFFANQNKFNVVWNMHAAAQVIEGARRGLPILVLIRQPEDVVISTKVMNPNLSMLTILKCYIRYYDCIKKYAPLFLTATRDQVDADFGCVSRRLNNKFNTKFEEFKHTKENVSAIINDMKLKLIKEYGENLAESVKRTWSYPDSSKDEFKRHCREEYRATMPDKYIMQANDIYNYYSSIAE